jgi:hypothetical protein
MEALTRLVADSLARHGLDRPIDPRRLQWSRWFRCDSPHSLLVVPSKPGIFALAEEVMDLGRGNASGASNVHVETSSGNAHVGKAKPGNPHVETAAPGCPERSSAAVSTAAILGGAALQRCDLQPSMDSASAAEGLPIRRMLAVLQFSEDDDMAFTLDRMFTQINPMRARLSSGRCFLRFVVIEDENQRRSICSALNQWLLNSAEKASGLPADFQSSLELTTDRVGMGDSPKDVGSSTARVGRTLLSDSAGATAIPAKAAQPINLMNPALNLDSGANKNLHCPHPLPSGF